MFAGTTRLKQDPFSGKLFVFTNRQRTSIKILVYDGQGFWLVNGNEIMHHVENRL
jgi:transposase